MWACVGLLGRCWRDGDGKEQEQEQEQKRQTQLVGSDLTSLQVKALAEDQCVIPSTHMVGHNRLGT